jgi:hypothetical protein
VFDIEALDELSTQPHIVSVSNIYYDIVIDKIIEVIVIFNRDLNETRILMFCEDIEGAIEMELTFWNELNSAKNLGEVVLLEGNEDLCDSLLSSPQKIFFEQTKSEQ